MTKPLRVLLLADDCNPDWPSLPVVGYKACRALADHAEVTVATHIRNKPQISRDGLGRAEVVYLDTEYIAKPMFKLSQVLRGGDKVAWTTHIAMGYPSYLAFEWEAYRRFRTELKQPGNGFDIVHRVTPMSPTLPSLMAARSKVPFVIGPLNGGLKWPAAFTNELKREREWLSYLRDVHRHMPYHAATFRKSAAILAAFPHTIDDLPDYCRDRAIDFPEVGIDPDVFGDHGAKAVRRPDEKIVFLFVGRLVPYKCADVVVRAFANSQKLRGHILKIVGDGPDRELLQSLIDQHGLHDCVELLGARKQTEVGELMRSADVFAFPSIRELGAGVVVEAMACGLPSVVVDYGGPKGLITEDTGIKVPLGSKDDLVERYVKELEALVDAPERCAALGARAHAVATELYTWDRKARKTIEVYEWVLGRRRDRPNFYELGQDNLGRPGPQLRPETGPKTT